MNQDFHTVFVPDWINSAILDNGGAPADVLDLERLSQWLAPDDLVYLLRFQSLHLATFQTEIFNASIDFLVRCWSAKPQFAPEAQTLSTLAFAGQSNHEQFMSEILAKFQAASAPATTDSGVPFYINDLSPAAAPGELIYSIVLSAPMLEGGLGNTMSADLQFALVEQVLERLYAARIPVHRVGTLALTKKYIDLRKTQVSISAL